MSGRRCDAARAAPASAQRQQQQLRRGRTGGGLGLLHGEHDGEQGPGEHVVDGGAAQRQVTELNLVETLLCDDSSQNWKSGDAHARANGQLVGQLRHLQVLAVQPDRAVALVVQPRAEHEAGEQKRGGDAEERDDSHLDAARPDLVQVNLQPHHEHEDAA